MECRTTLERVVARRAKETCTNESVVGTVIGVGESATRKPSVGLYKST